MPEDFVIAVNPEAETSLPYLLRIPLGPGGIVLKARDTWPRTTAVYCHRAEGWPEEPDVVERTPTRSCVRRGAAIDLVLARGRENRSQFVLTRARGREVIFWQTARVAKQARPNVDLPTARAPGVTGTLEIVVDSHERYAWKFGHQQAVTAVRALRAGDYGVELDGELVASVERKSLADLVSTLTGGRLRSVLAALAGLPHAAVVVEDRYSKVFQLEHVRPSVVADGLAECQARFPSVPVVFCETRALAQEWTYRFLGAALAEAMQEAAAQGRFDELPTAGPLAPAPGFGKGRARRSARSAPSGAGGAGKASVAGEAGSRSAPPLGAVRAWARSQGLPVAARGRVAASVLAAYAARSPDE